MQYLFLEYPACSTCRKARKWLEEQGIVCEDRDVVKNRPTVVELKEWVKRSGLPLKSFFNTSGLVYRSLQLKDRLSEMSEEEQICLLASDGKLVKRPILVAGEQVLVGFQVDTWKKVIKWQDK